MKQMEQFVEKHVNCVPEDQRKKLAVLDVGARDINGTYRDLFAGHDYSGMDIEDGPNVDILGWADVKGEHDVVISGQVVEHCAEPKELMENMGKHLKTGGLMCLIVPSRQQEGHRRPDYWRFTADGVRQLMAWAGVEPIVEIREQGRDVVGIGKKL